MLNVLEFECHVTRALGLQRARRRRSTERDLAVRQIADEQQIVVTRESNRLIVELLADACARGIVRVVHDHQPCAARVGGRNRVEIEDEAIGRSHGDPPHFGTGKPDGTRVDRIEYLGDQRRVAGTAECRDDASDPFFRAG
jgi:hypothetical protein